MISIVLLILAGCSTTNVQDSQPQGEEVINTMPEKDNTPQMGAIEKEEIEDSQKDNVKEVTLTGENFKFVINGKDNSDINVKQGEKVKITFKVTDGFHDWVVDEFNAKTTKVKAGETTTVEFTADKKGTFEYYCSVGDHKQKGMKGKLIVS